MFLSKKLTNLLIFGILLNLLCSFPIFAQTPPFGGVDANGANGFPNDSVSVDVIWQNTAPESVGAVILDIAYDPNVLTSPDTANCLNNDPGYTFSSCNITDNDGLGTDNIRVSFSQFGGTGFVATANPLGSIGFTIDSSAPAGPTNLTVTISGGSGSGQCAGQNSAGDVSCNPVSDVVVVNGTANGTLTSSIDFGNQPVSGGPSAPMNAILTSTGTEDLNITGISITTNPSGVFAIDNGVSNSCTTGTLSSNCNIGVTCDPAAAISYNGVLTVTFSNFGNLTSNLSCTGITAGPLLTPNPLTFSGDESTTETGFATLENVGGLDFTVDTISIENDTQGAFSLPTPDNSECNDGGPTTLGNGESCLIEVECDVPDFPVTQATATLRVSFQGNTPPSDVTIGLTCTPNLPNPQLTPNTLTLAAPVGDTVSNNLTLLNNGAANLNGISIPASAGVFTITDDCADTLPDTGDNDCTITAECTASTTLQTALLTVSFSNANSVSSTLRCQPLFPDPQLNGPLNITGPVGDTVSDSLTLRNNGQAPFTGITIPASAGGFTVTGDTCSDFLNPGASCNIDVECTVQQTSFSNTLTVTGNNTPTVSATATLNCNPLLPEPQLDPMPQLTIQGLPDDEVTEPATLSNVGDAPLNGISIPSTAGPFDIANVNCPTNLGEGNSCTIDVSCTVTEEDQTATLVVSFSNAESVSLPILCRGALPIPTLSPWGLLILAGLLGLFGIRRRVAMQS